MRKLNVLQFICPAGFYGAEMWILALAKHLDPDLVNCQLAITRESEDQNIEVFNRFQQLGLGAHQIKVNGRFDPGSILKLARLLKREKIDIIHTHGYKSDILGLLAARLANVKIVATPHGFENVKDLKLQLFIRLGCFALRFCDGVAPLSEDLFAEIQRFKVKKEKIRLIINGVDLAETQAALTASTSLFFTENREKKIGYVGQIAHRKNIGDMIKAFDVLHEDHPEVSLVLVGDGPMRDELEKMSHTLPSASRIKFLGYRKDRLRIVKELDVFSMTSSLEGIPRCMMEAMSMGIPSVAFRIPGVDKLIIHGVTGLMADYGNVEELKKCWEKLLLDDEYSYQIAENGKQHVLNNFSAQRMAEEYVEMFQGICPKS